MPSLALPISYLKAVHTAARGRMSRYPVAIHSVLLSRFRYGIGPRLHSLFGLIDVPREKWGDYLLDEQLRVVLRRINPPEAREIVSDKLAFHDHCVAHGLATIPIRCLISSRLPDGTSSTPHVASEGAFADALHPDDDRLFFKLVNGTWGMDAFSASRTDTGWRYDGKTGTTAELFAFAMARLGGRRGWIVQPLIRAHLAVNSISSQRALSTIRAVTCRDGEEIKLLFAGLRIPVGNSVTDNFTHGASGNVIAPVDLESGELGPCRGSNSRRWPEIVNIPIHPDTQTRIEGFQIPQWDDLKALLTCAHTSLPRLHTLGWDIAVTDNGPLIVETNATYDVDLIQVAHRFGIRPILVPLLQRGAADANAVLVQLSELR